MSIRNAFENILIELNKVQAPSLLLDDFIYLFNKGVQEYVNERYNLFESKQQLTDDLRVLIKSEELTTGGATPTISSWVGSTLGKSYKCTLPSDYYHMLNCTAVFRDASPKCDLEGDLYLPVNKLNTDQRSQIVNNYYLKPSVDSPYYYISNIDNPSNDSVGHITDDSKKTNASLYSASGGILGNERYGNSMLPVMQFLCGNSRKYILKSIFIDYLRAPKYYSLTLDELDSIVDLTQILEFPDYVVYEIINRIVRIIMENGSNPRMLSHTPVNTSII